MFSISEEQFANFEDRARDDWAKKAARQLVATYPDHFATLRVTDADLTPSCAAIEKWAARHEITGERDVQKLCFAALSLGHRFWMDPRFRSYIEATVANKRIVKSRRADAFVEKTKAWLGGLWAQDDVYAFGACLVAALEDKTAAGYPLAITLQGVLPGHWAQYSDSDNDRAIAELLNNCEQHGLTCDGQCLAYVACALAFGFHWWTDPQYAQVANAVRSATDDAALSKQLALLLRVSD